MWRIWQAGYTALLTLLCPFLFVRLWIKGRRIPSYRQRWRERLGKAPFPPLKNAFWIHAVSVGEVMAAQPLLVGLRSRYPEAPVVLTTTTPTGSERVRAVFHNQLGQGLYHCYLPYDLPWTMISFLNHIRPRLLILMETELWPTLLTLCAKRKIPVMIANARLSLQSLRQYRWGSWWVSGWLRAIRVVGAQSALDAKRFHALGVPWKQIWDTGNIKFDCAPPPLALQVGEQLRRQIGKERLVWIAASTHEGEEALLLSVYRQLKPSFSSLLLFLVPRHPERFQGVEQLCQKGGLIVRRRTEIAEKTLPREVDVLVGDTMGELYGFYAASDVAFVGGSLVPIGGHNLLEPAVLGLPIVTGSYLFHFEAVSHLLQKAQAVIIVETASLLEESLRRLFQEPSLGLMQGERAKAVVSQNRGAVEKTLQLIEEC